MLQSAMNAFWSLTKAFPAWMDVRKRQEKTISGKYLLSVVKERDTFKAILEDFKSRFFLTHYIGRENELISSVYIAHVGRGVEYLTDPDFKIIEDVDIFAENETGYALYQNGYIILRKNTPSGFVYYSVGNAKFSAKLNKTQIWNIIDEYALFLCLERYEGESNVHLMKRCLAVFKNPANSTKTGLQNVIINAMMNDLPIERDDIKIEIPESDNLFLEDEEFDTIFERLAQFNRDIFRTKRFDLDLWEQKFRELEWLPHPWDSIPEMYQDGVGQLDDLKIGLPTTKVSETTDVEINGYVKSRLILEQYLHKNMITRTMILGLKRYLNTLRPATLDYKITATEVRKIDANSIKIESRSCLEGEKEYYLADIIENPFNLTILQRNVLETNGIYKLKFFPKSSYEPLELNEALLTKKDGTEVDLRQEDSRFKFIDGVLTDSSTLFHLRKLKQALTYNNLVDSANGIRIKKGETSGSLIIDISKFGEKSLSYEIDTKGLLDITYNDNFIKRKGFTLNKTEDILTASDASLDQNLEINLKCSEISFDFLKTSDPADQGSVFVNINIDGSKDIFDSGIWNTGRNFHRKFNKMTQVKIKIQKISSNPVSIANIKASRYNIIFKPKYGAIIHTPFSTVLPPSIPNNTLEVILETYDSLTPTLKFIHIGDDANTHYETGTFTVSDGSSHLDIDSNWRAELYMIVGGTEKLIDNNFVSKSKYRNDTYDDIRVPINIEDFESISDSSIPIEKTMYLGELTAYITVHPGQTIESISIAGKIYLSYETFSLSEILNKTVNENVYVTIGANAFIIRNESTLEEKLVKITPDMFDQDFDTFSFINVPNNFTGCFSQDSDGETVTKSNKTFNGFVTAWIEPLTAQEYIAYNQEILFMAEMSDVTIKDTWNASFDETKLWYYTLQLSENSIYTQATAKFEKIKNSKKIYEDWSLGKKNIFLSLGLNSDKREGYNAETFTIDIDYIVQPTIRLEEQYIVDGIYQELSKFIITPPAGMDISYKQEEYGELFYAEEDGFNKLKYSNVTDIVSVKVNNAEVSSDRYTLIETEGIIYWNDPLLFGEAITVTYHYKVPEFIFYKSIDEMYEIVSFAVDAYEKLDEIVTLKKMKDGEIRTYNFKSKDPDKVVVEASNDRFKLILGTNTVKATVTDKNSGMLLKTGYYYDDKDEYYYFNHIKKDSMCKMDNVTLHNVYLIDDQYVFVRETSNYLLDTAMVGTRLDVLCDIDCKKHEEIEGVSRLGVFTSCDTYSCWNDFKMTMQLIAKNNSYSINFIPQQEKSYALINITQGIGKNIKLSFETTGELKFKIMKEIIVDSNNLKHSVYTEFLGTPTTDGKYLSFLFDENTDLKSRYYLMVQGLGTLDNMIMANKDMDLNKLHTKKMNLLGFIPEEERYETYKEPILFDPHFNVMENTELDNVGKISTTSNVAYGLTKIFDMNSSKKVQIKNFDVFRENNAYYSEGKEGELVLTGVYIPYVTSVRNIYVKVNDVIIDDFKGFTIQLDISENGDKYSKYKETKKANLLKAPYSGDYPYLQIHIKMPSNKVINNIEIYAMYQETADNLFIDTYDRGEFTTKIYDIGTSGNYSFYAIDGEVNQLNGIEFYMRGIREDENGYGVFTDWYQCNLDDNLKISNVPHIFKDYRLFQFKIIFKSEDSFIKIKEFVLQRI